MSTEHSNDHGVVYKKNLGQYHVHAGGRVVSCVLSSRLRKQLIYPTADPHSRRPRVDAVHVIEYVDPVAIGDQVQWIDAGDGSGMIVKVLPRRNKLTRPAPVPGERVFEQVIVANADQVIPVFAAANPPPKWGLLDRYLVSAAAAGLPALICINKLDLARAGGELHETIAAYRRLGYPVLLASAKTGEGLDELREVLQGRVSVLVGKSGVGKTSLLNALQPDLGLRVRALSRIEKGRHTTSHLEMFPLDFGGALVDTPGMREFGLWNIRADELAALFPEMQPLVGRCKFRLDCRHDEEPGCAIRKAVMAGQISPQRYKSYLRLAEEL